MNILSVLQERFNRRRRPGRWLLETLAAVGSLASVVGLVVAIPNGEPLVRTLALATLAVVGVGGTAVGFWLHWKSLRRSRYAETHFYTHHVVHFIRNELAKIELLNLRDEALQQSVKSAVKVILDAICQTFTVVTGASCRTCIKVLDEPNSLREQAITREQMCEFGEVRVFSRDSVSAAFMDPNGDGPSKLNCNPRFLELFKDGNRRYYLCQDCGDRGQHQTDSFTKYPHGLPYRSVFVWPIRLPAYAYPEVDQNHKPTQKIVGFLIVACARPKAFDERFDFEIGALFADALYGFLTRCHVRYYGREQVVVRPVSSDLSAAGIPAAESSAKQPAL